MEKQVQYITGTAITVEAFKNRLCVLPKENENFALPSPDEVKSARHLLGLSQTGLAKFVGVSWSQLKGSPTVRKWETQVGKTEHRPMNYTAWRMMLIALGVVSQDDIKNEVAEYR